jgi:L-cysteine desulfidase
MVGVQFKIPTRKEAAIREYLNFGPIDVVCIESPDAGYRLIGIRGTDHATVHIANNHMNIVSIEKNGEVMLSRSLWTPRG